MIVTLRLTAAEASTVRRLADSEGKTVSDFIRARICELPPLKAARVVQRNSKPHKLAVDDLATVLAAAKVELETSNMPPLVMVAAVVRRSKLATERAHVALREAERSGLLELRPESGMGRLSKADAALCVPGPQGSLLSVLRVIGAEEA